jgi:dolichol kinase
VKDNHSQPFVTIGAVIWLLASLVVRLAGHLIFNPRSGLYLALFLVSVPLIWMLTFPLYRRYVPDNPGGQALAALQFVTLPILLELPSFLFHPLLFPNMGETRMVYYAAFLFFFYGLVLATGWMKQR